MTTVHLPASLQWVADLIGEPFPAGDEDRCRGQAARWRVLADALETHQGAIDAAARRTLEGFCCGDLSDAITIRVHSLTSGGGSVEALVCQLRLLADAVDHAGDEIMRAKRTIIAELARAAVRIRAILACAIIGGGASALQVSEAVVAARLAVTKVIDDAVMAISRAATGRTITPIGFTPMPAAPSNDGPAATGGKPERPAATAASPAGGAAGDGTAPAPTVATTSATMRPAGHPDEAAGNPTPPSAPGRTAPLTPKLVTGEAPAAVDKTTSTAPATVGVGKAATGGSATSGSAARGANDAGGSAPPAAGAGGSATSAANPNGTSSGSGVPAGQDGRAPGSVPATPNAPTTTAPSPAQPLTTATTGAATTVTPVAAAAPAGPAQGAGSGPASASCAPGTTTSVVPAGARGDVASGSESTASAAARQAPQPVTSPSTAESTRASDPVRAGSEASATRGALESRGPEAAVHKSAARSGGDAGKDPAGQQDHDTADGATDSPHLGWPGLPGMAMMPPMFGGEAVRPGEPEPPAKGERPRRQAPDVDGAPAVPREPDPVASRSGVPAEQDTPADPAPAGVCWQEVLSLDFEHSRRIADEALSRLGMTAGRLRHRLGDVASTPQRVSVNAGFWAALSAGEQVALVRGYPLEVANSVGIPIQARTAAADLVLAGQHLPRVRSDAGLRGGERGLLHRLAVVRRVCDAVRAEVCRLNPDWDVYVWALDPDGDRAVVMVGADPGHTAAHHVHVACGTLADLDELLSHAVGRLCALDTEGGSMTCTVWLGEDPADAVRVGAVVCSDITAFNAEHDIVAGGSFSNNHLYADAAPGVGVLAGETTTIALTACSGTGPSSVPSADSALVGGLGAALAGYGVAQPRRGTACFGGGPVSRGLRPVNPCVRQVARLW